MGAKSRRVRSNKKNIGLFGQSWKDEGGRKREMRREKATYWF